MEHLQKLIMYQATNKSKQISKNQYQKKHILHPQCNLDINNKDK